MTDEIKGLYEVSQRLLAEFEEKIKYRAEKFPHKNYLQLRVAGIIKEYSDHSLATIFVLNDFLYVLQECESEEEIDAYLNELSGGDYEPPI